MVGFSSAYLFPGKEMGGSCQGWNHLTRGIDYLMRRKTQGTSTVKGWEDKQDCGLIPDSLLLLVLLRGRPTR